MSRTTIDFGIDLGTTNSSIGVIRGTEVDIILNNESQPITPSAVMVDKGGRIIVGRSAKEGLMKDHENAFCEFKLQMGENTEYVFRRSGRRSKPEDLSAEVLKSLKADVRLKLKEDIEAAVITVPAAFELPQCEATRQAAQQAGLHTTILIQEPVAAALAYGFQTESEKVYWLVYDLGGGTFDAAVMQVRDDEIRVVHHDGDNHLGGKLIDWAIVEDLLVPALLKEHRLPDFQRGNPKWEGAFHALKCYAENAKIRVSRDEKAYIDIPFICHEYPKPFEFELKRDDVERLARPIIIRSINLCKKVLAEKRLGFADIEKVLLVGGPTLMPYLRNLLSDTNDGLGIPLSYTNDPLTVVTHGASIYAGTKRLESATPIKAAKGQYVVDLEYKPSGPDTEPFVWGRVRGYDGEIPDGLTIEFINTDCRQQWRSGRIGISPDGTFRTNVLAEKGRRNVFSIELFDARGTKLNCQPDNFAYTVAIEIVDPPLPHNVGVALVNNDMNWVLEKGTPLPVRRKTDLKSAFEVRKGVKEHIIKIPLMEGQKARANRNKYIGTLEIYGDQITRDVPAGSDVEVTIHIDQSRQMVAKAYIPILDEEYELKFNKNGYSDKRNQEEIAKELEIQKKRLETVREKARGISDGDARRILQQIDEERMIQDVEKSLAASRTDRDASVKCEKRLLDLMSAIDEVEDAIEWPSLVSNAEREIEEERKIVNNNDFGVKPDEKRLFTDLEREVRTVMDTRDADHLALKVRELERLGITILFRQPGWWVGCLDHLENRRSTMSNQDLAGNYIAQGRRAINTGDLESLKAAVRQLWGLLPPGDKDREIFSTVGK